MEDSQDVCDHIYTDNSTFSTSTIHRLMGAEKNVPPALLLRFLAAAVKLGPCCLPGARIGSFGGQVILPLAHMIEHEELLEVIKMEGVGHCPEESLIPRDMFLLQVCNGMDENTVGMCAEVIFAPIDASFADDAPLLPSGFRIIPLHPTKFIEMGMMGMENINFYNDVVV